MPLSQILIDGEGWQVVSEGHAFTDGATCDGGGFYFTETRKRQVTSISPDGKVASTNTHITSPNGITLSPDQGTLAVSDYGGENVWVYRIEADGSLAHEMPYMTMRRPSSALPAQGDGMASDIHGRYYVTTAVGLQMFDPTGRMGGVILKPQDKPLVSVSFAGPELGYLYVCCGDKVYRRKTKSRGVLFFAKEQ
jgi:gluconolactonase